MRDKLNEKSLAELGKLAELAKIAEEELTPKASKKGSKKIILKGLKSVGKATGPITNTASALLDYKDKIDEGKSVKRALVETVGETSGGIAGEALLETAAGSVVPDVGTAVGGIVGGVI